MKTEKNIIKKAASAFIAVGLFINLAGGCAQKNTNATQYPSATNETTSFQYTERDTDYAYDESSGLKIDLNSLGEQTANENYSFKDGTLTISDQGVYMISGTLNGQIAVNVAKDAKVQLVLDGAFITSEKTAAINIISADKVFITLADGSENFLCDAYVYTELNASSEPDAAVFSKADLTINGLGSLTVTANYNHGIHSKDDLVITGGNISVESVNDALKGKDAVAICGGSMTLTCGGDGIQSNNDSDEGKGNVYLDGGEVNIVCGEDGIQAERCLYVNADNISIISGGGATGNEKAQTGGFHISWGEDVSQTNETSCKGLKGGSCVVIASGDITVDAADDSVHSNGTIIINGGNLKLSSGDDGVHADEALEITSATIDVVKCYEGLEAASVTVNGGSISVNSSDDGINASGGNASSSSNSTATAVKGFGGQGGGMETDDGSSITINGGSISLVTEADGIDSNGSIYINGGEVYVFASSSGADGALDYAGECKVTAGKLIAAGSAAMSQNISADSSVCGVLISANGSQNEVLTVKDSEGTQLYNGTIKKAFTSILLCLPEFEVGETYSVDIGDSTYTAQFTESVINIGGMFPQTPGSGDFKPDGGNGFRP